MVAPALVSASVGHGAAAPRRLPAEVARGSVGDPFGRARGAGIARVTGRGGRGGGDQGAVLLLLLLLLLGARPDRRSAGARLGRASFLKGERGTSQGRLVSRGVLDGGRSGGVAARRAGALVVRHWRKSPDAWSQQQ